MHLNDWFSPQVDAALIALLGIPSAYVFGRRGSQAKARADDTQADKNEADIAARRTELRDGLLDDALDTLRGVQEENKRMSSQMTAMWSQTETLQTKSEQLESRLRTQRDEFTAQLNTQEDDCNLRIAAMNEKSEQRYQELKLDQQAQERAHGRQLRQIRQDRDTAIAEMYRRLTGHSESPHAAEDAGGAAASGE